jgi:hypothetical protein
VGVCLSYFIKILGARTHQGVRLSNCQSPEVWGLSPRRGLDGAFLHCLECQNVGQIFPCQIR